jgi:hypothetical protein
MHPVRCTVLGVAARAATILLLPATLACATRGPWLRGNLHTHSFWSDGDQFPEVALLWYRDHGYDFVAVSDHNTITEGERWLTLGGDTARVAAFAEYRRRFGDDWVQTRRNPNGATEVRLRPFGEYAARLNTRRFLVIQSEEISDRFETRPLHLNATNIAEYIAPQGGRSVADVLQRNIDAVLEQRRGTGRVIVPHVNHPNFGWAVTAEDLIGLAGERFFEVYNGHWLVHNDGDSLHPSTERLWDIVLTARLAAGAGALFGLATDDAHNYGRFDSAQANPGRGWVMVRARERSAEAILAALERGDFYATTGVRLDDVRISGEGIELRIHAEPGVRYETEFVGTRRGYDSTTAALPDVAGLPVTRRYSDDIGVVLARVEGTAPAYRFAGNELYVRARVRSTARMTNGVVAGEVQRAWTQPITPDIGSPATGH